MSLSAPASTITVSPRRSMKAGAPTPLTVVSLNGEHDICTVMALTDALDLAMERDGASLAVDLRHVEFMGAATLGVIVHARELLQADGRSLVLRDPSAIARRVVDLCGLHELLESAHPGTDHGDPSPGGP